MVRARRDVRVVGRAGQALVEFVLVAPLLMLILGALVDFGMGFGVYLDVTKAVHDATSYAGRHNTPDLEIRSLLQKIVGQYGLNQDAAVITITRPIVEGLNSVRVTLTYPYVPYSPGVQATLGAVMQMSAQAVYATAQ